MTRVKCHNKPDDLKPIYEFSDYGTSWELKVTALVRFQFSPYRWHKNQNLLPARVIIDKKK